MPPLWKRPRKLFKCFTRCLKAPSSPQTPRTNLPSEGVFTIEKELTLVHPFTEEEEEEQLAVEESKPAAEELTLVHPFTEEEEEEEEEEQKKVEEELAVEAQSQGLWSHGSDGGTEPHLGTAHSNGQQCLGSSFSRKMAWTKGKFVPSAQPLYAESKPAAEELALVDFTEEEEDDDEEEDEEDEEEDEELAVEAQSQGLRSHGSDGGTEPHLGTCCLDTSLERTSVHAFTEEEEKEEEEEELAMEESESTDSEDVCSIHTLGKEEEEEDYFQNSLSNFIVEEPVYTDNEAYEDQIKKLKVLLLEREEENKNLKREFYQLVGKGYELYELVPHIINERNEAKIQNLLLLKMNLFLAKQREEYAQKVSIMEKEINFLRMKLAEADELLRKQETPLRQPQKKEEFTEEQHQENVQTQKTAYKQGDPSVKRCRHSQSLPREKAASSDQPMDELMLEMMSIVDEYEGAPLHEEPGIIPKTSGVTDGLQPTDEMEATEEEEEEQVELEDCQDIPPGVARSYLSPASCLPVRESKQSKVSATQRVRELMQQKLRRKHHNMMEMSHCEHNQLLAILQASQEDPRTTNQTGYESKKEVTEEKKEFTEHNANEQKIKHLQNLLKQRDLKIKDLQQKITEMQKDFRNKSKFNFKKMHECWTNTGRGMLSVLSQILVVQMLLTYNF